MSTRTVAIDASTKKTGVAILNDGQLTEYKLIDKSKITDKELRTMDMAKSILNLLDIYQPDIVVIEDSWNAVNVEVTKILTRIIGVTYGWSIEHSASWYQLLPSQWRKMCGMDQGKKKREELKQMSIDYVKKRFNVDVNDDVADAICIGVAYDSMFSDDDLF